MHIASDNELLRPVRRGHWGWLVLHGLALVAGIVAISAVPGPVPSHFLVNRVAPATVISRARVTYVDRIATQRARHRVAAAVPTVFRSNVAAARASRSAADTLIGSVLRVLSRGRKFHSRTAQTQVQQLLVNASTPTEGLPHLDSHGWRIVRRRTRALLTASIQVLKPFSSSGVQRAIQVLDTSLPNSASATTQVAEDIVRTFITPTLVVDRRAMRIRVRAAEARVQPIRAVVPARTTVIAKGQLITPAIYQKLRAVGIPRPQINWSQYVGAGVFALALVVLTIWYLDAFFPQVTGSPRLMPALDVMILVTAGAARIALPGHQLLPYFFPLAGVTALTGLLVSAQVGVALAVMLSLLVGWLIGATPELMTYLLLTAVAGAMAVRRLKRPNDFLIIGASVTAIAVLVVLSFHVAGAHGWTLRFVRDFGGAAVVVGLFSGAMAFGGFLLLGTWFGATSALQLLELGHPDQPLLRRLMADAPGTYNHSLVVASMVERAAQATNADSLLARVMALYHDVGKIANPLCFIENQIGTGNIHDDLTPQESAEIIRAHVTHGASLARQQRLPVPILDGIMQHHGTMLMSVFFHKALAEDPSADASAYAYPGPRPSTKEAALLMLADACEGAVRALPRKSPETIRDTVDQIVDERMAADQLSQCELTLRDLATVRVALIDVLNGIYHPRVEYPTPIRSPARRASGTSGS